MSTGSISPLASNEEITGYTAGDRFCLMFGKNGLHWTNDSSLLDEIHLICYINSDVKLNACIYWWYL